MRLLKFILLLTPLITVGQSKKKCKQSYQFYYRFSEGRFDIDSSGFHGAKKSDTIYYTNHKIAAIGSYAINKELRTSGYKVGLWTEYFANGQIKSQGNYDMFSLLICASAMPRRQDYSYKFGEWTYYYETGQLKAKGEYKVTKYEVHTGIANQFGKKSTVTNSWTSFNIDGTTPNDKAKLIAEIEWNPNCD